MKKIAPLIICSLFLLNSSSQKLETIIGYNALIALHHDEFSVDLIKNKFAFGIDFGRTRSYGGHVLPIKSDIEYTNVTGEFFKIVPKYIVFNNYKNIVMIGIGYLGSFYFEEAKNLLNNQIIIRKGFASGAIIKFSLNHLFYKNFGFEAGSQVGYIFRDNHIDSQFITNQPGGGSFALLGFTQLTVGITYTFRKKKLNT